MSLFTSRATRNALGAVGATALLDTCIARHRIAV